MMVFLKILKMYIITINKSPSAPLWQVVFDFLFPRYNSLTLILITVSYLIYLRPPRLVDVFWMVSKNVKTCPKNVQNCLKMSKMFKNVNTMFGGVEPLFYFQQSSHLMIIILGNIQGKDISKIWKYVRNFYCFTP